MVSFYVGMVAGSLVSMLAAFVFVQYIEAKAEKQHAKAVEAAEAQAKANAAEKAKEKQLLDQVARVANENMIALVEVQNQIKGGLDTQIEDLKAGLKRGEDVLAALHAKFAEYDKTAAKEMDTIGTVLESFKKRLDAMQEE